MDLDADGMVLVRLAIVIQCASAYVLNSDDCDD